jgi:uncharacterized protein YdeI (YjbR/CyaY-like superfamily)
MISPLLRTAMNCKQGLLVLAFPSRRARRDGRWDAAYDGQRTATVPEDLQHALDADPAARDFFATLDSANRYAILYRLHEAKRPETRARRLADYVAMLAAQQKIHP